MLSQYYSLNSHKDLQNFVDVYLPLVENFLQKFNIDLSDNIFKGDHLGVQTLSTQEFDIIDELLSTYSKIIHAGSIHKRRNHLQYKNIQIDLIEIFEPKPGADIRKLKPGIEHIAFINLVEVEFRNDSLAGISR